jgi:hypothetical protein
MSITYSAQQGTTVTSAAATISVSVGDFSGNNLNNVASTLASSNNGNIGTKFTGYAGRILEFNDQYRLITAESGTAPNITLTLNDEITGADLLSGTATIFYDVDDIETGGVSNGINLNTKSGFYELSNLLNVGTGDTSGSGRLALNSGQCLELDDRNNNVSMIIGGGGLNATSEFVLGYTDRNGTPLGGGVIVAYNGTAGETLIQTNIGGTQGEGIFIAYNSVLWSQKFGVQTNFQWPDSVFDGCIFIDFTRSTGDPNTSKLDKVALLRNTSFTAKTQTDHDLQIDFQAHSDSTTFDRYANIVFNNLDSLNRSNFVDFATLLGVSGTREVVLKNCKWIGVNQPYKIQQGNNNVDDFQLAAIDPDWDATTDADTGFASASFDAYIFDCSLCEVSVQDDALAPIANCVVAPYSRFGSTSTDQYRNPNDISHLQNVRWTNSDGFVETYFYNRNYNYLSGTNSTTTAVSTFVRADAYGYKPYVQGLTQFEPLITLLTLQEDSDLVETVRATAESTFDAATPTLDVRGFDTERYYIFEFDTGTGTVAVGDTITATANDTFLVEAFVTGDSTEGAILAGPGTTPSGSSWTGSGGWAANVTAFYPVGAVLDANNGLSIQQVYDGMAAELAKNTVQSFTNPFQYPLAQFCESLTTQPITKNGSKWIGNNGRAGGFAVINTTDSITNFSQIGDYVFPVATTVTLAQLQLNSEVRVYSQDGSGDNDVELDGVENSGTSFSFVLTAGTIVNFVVFNKAYEPLYFDDFTVPSSDQTVQIQQRFDRNFIGTP